MKELLLLRHAKSSWNDSQLHDHQRPLNARGRGDAPRMGSLLKRLELLPEAILSSDSARTRETVDLLLDGADCTIPTTYLPELYHAAPGELLACAREAAEEKRIMLVAHNPGMEDLQERLSGEYEPFPTAALAAFRLRLEDWSSLTADVEAERLGLWRPKELPR